MDSDVSGAGREISNGLLDVVTTAGAAYPSPSPSALPLPQPLNSESSEEKGNSDYRSRKLPQPEGRPNPPSTQPLSLPKVESLTLEDLDSGDRDSSASPPPSFKSLRRHSMTSPPSSVHSSELPYAKKSPPSSADQADAPFSYQRQFAHRSQSTRPFAQPTSREAGGRTPGQNDNRSADSPLHGLPPPPRRAPQIKSSISSPPLLPPFLERSELFQGLPPYRNGVSGRFHPSSRADDQKVNRHFQNDQIRNPQSLNLSPTSPPHNQRGPSFSAASGYPSPPSSNPPLTPNSSSFFIDRVSSPRTGRNHQETRSIDSFSDFPSPPHTEYNGSGQSLYSVGGSWASSSGSSQRSFDPYTAPTPFILSPTPSLRPSTSSGHTFGEPPRIFREDIPDVITTFSNEYPPWSSRPRAFSQERRAVPTYDFTHQDQLSTPNLISARRGADNADRSPLSKINTKPPSNRSLQSPESPTTFVFPGGRSLAKPKKIEAKKEKELKRLAEGPSEGANAGEEKSRSKFMGISLKKKKKKLATDDIPPPPEKSTANPVTEGTPNGTQSSERSNLTPVQSPTHEEHATNDGVMDLHQRQEYRPKSSANRESTPLNAYDSTLLAQDRKTHQLLHRLWPAGSPCFHEYGRTPPNYVLDLGCGQGHWLLDAALAWRQHGTTVVGFDAVDLMKSVWPHAVKEGVASNIKFVKGNFLKHNLPFPDECFDLVRMANLSLCVPYDQWEELLREISRILAVGGRLELIDDHVIFPVGKVGEETPPSPASTLSPHGSNAVYPHGNGHNQSHEVDIYDLYGPQLTDDESDDGLDTATLGGHRATRRHHSSHKNSTDQWARAVTDCTEVETVFEEMLFKQYGIHMRPSEFMVDLFGRVFGQADNPRTIHLTLAPPDQQGSADLGFAGTASEQRGKNGNVKGSLSLSPGLMVWPSTFLKMSATDVEAHSTKNIQLLLTCRNAIVQHVARHGEDDTSIREALFEYEGFMRRRFDPPLTPPQSRLDGPRDRELHSSMSIRESVFSVSSDTQDAMYEYQDDLRHRYQLESPVLPSLSTPGSPVVQLPFQTSSSSSSQGPVSPRPIKPIRASILAPSIAPPYSRKELTHVRSFHIYHVVKAPIGWRR